MVLGGPGPTDGAVAIAFHVLGSGHRMEVMFGSTFPNDLSDMFVAMNLQSPLSLRCLRGESTFEGESCGLSQLAATLWDGPKGILVMVGH